MNLICAFLFPKPVSLRIRSFCRSEKRLAKPFLCFSLSSVYRKKSIIRLGMLFNIRIMFPPFFRLLLFVSICLFRRFFYLFYRVLCFRGLLVYTLAFFILTVWLLF